jgi:tRNA/tmRNA/rRNA uracil-C5-methylase (TrmA/RlmC/RlmD family)
MRASPHRVAAKCAVYGVCGGCSLMHMDPAEQTRQKEQATNRFSLQIHLKQNDHNKKKKKN